MDTKRAVSLGDGPAIGNREEDEADRPARPDSERVAERAYQRFEERGREHGHDVEDWLEAEREVSSSGPDPYDDDRWP